MTPGHDKVTFENFAKPGTKYDSKDTDWYFETYGPPTKKGQTFHEHNEGSVGEKDKNNVTMAASTTRLEGTITNPATFRLTPDGTSAKVADDLTIGTKVVIVEKKSFWSRVRVLDGPQKNQFHQTKTPDNMSFPPDYFLIFAIGVENVSQAVQGRCSPGLFG